MSETNTKQQVEYSDEIDLVELIAMLWKEKWIVIVSVLVTTIAGVIYATTATHIYKVSTQLVEPPSLELTYLNQTGFFSISPEEAFVEFIEVLDSSNHISELTNSNKAIIESALGITNTDNSYNSINSIRKIEYPNTAKKKNSIEPDKYFFFYQGINRKNLKTLTLLDLESAKKTTINNIYSRYNTALLLKIQQMEKEQELKQQILDDKLKARKQYVIASRKKRVKELSEAVKIAKTLGLNSPTSLVKLSSSNTPKQVEINAELNNNQDPLYLRGSKLLLAEIESLQNLGDTVFLDNEIIRMEAERLLLENNRLLEQLKRTQENTSNTTDIQFYSEDINSPIYPIKPNKKLMVLISILLGGVIGLLIAIGKITYKNLKLKAANT